MVKLYQLGRLFFIVCCCLSTQAHANENRYSLFIEKLHASHQSGRAFQMEWISALTALNQLGSEAPRIPRFQKAIEALASTYDRHQTDTLALVQFWEQHRSYLQLPKNVLVSLRKISREQLDQFSTLIDKLNLFSQSIRVENYTLYANEPWSNSGIQVTASDIVWVGATGSWSMKTSGEHADWTGYPQTLKNPYSLNPEAHLGALLYRVRGSGLSAGYPVPDNQYALMINEGRLEFRTNDTDLSNNQGQLALQLVVFDWQMLSELMTDIRQLANAQ